VKVIIQDASVLIDMADCDLLDAWFGLGFDLRTTSLVWREVNRKNQKIKLKRYVDEGRFGVEAVGAQALTEIVQLQASLSARVTLEDVSAIFFADKLQSILLTGDKRLRQHAEQLGIETHGLLWVFDTLVARGALLPGVAADRLEGLIERGTSRLPLHECELRIRKWRR
jgi:predicted nucleic acid-binding protein